MDGKYDNGNDSISLAMSSCKISDKLIELEEHFYVV